MKKSLLVIPILLFATLACNANLPQAQSVTPLPELPQGQGNLPQSEASVPRVTVEEAKAALDSGAAIIVDVRSPDAFAVDHVAGAISIPLGLIESDPSGLVLDKDQWIITYCT